MSAKAARRVLVAAPGTHLLASKHVLLMRVKRLT